MKWHIIEGEDGCRFARENNCVAIVVDALRASATAAMLFHHGAESLVAVTEVEEALAVKALWPHALLFGERNGLPPEGFDYGNSPYEAEAARDKQVIFTTTTGAGRLVSSWGAAAVYMGSTVNARAVANQAQDHGKDVVLIPAGLMHNPDFDAQEDWAAAAAIAMEVGAEVATGNALYLFWRTRIEQDGLPALFANAPHAEKLRGIDLERDIAFCAQLNLTNAVPKAVAPLHDGILVQNR